MTSQRTDNGKLLRDKRTLVVHYSPRLKASCGVILTSPDYEGFQYIEDALEDGGSFCPNCFSSE
jgi:hypothetical protein